MADIKDSKNWGIETKAVQAGQENPESAYGARAVPIYATSAYVFRNSQHAADRFGLRDSGNIYSRLTNPTEDVFEQRIAALEGGTAAIATASGAAAITYTAQALAKSGEHIVSSKTIYGGTFNLFDHTLPLQNNVTTTFVDPSDPENFEKAIQPNTKFLYAESLGNPNGNVVDFDAIAEIAHKHHIPFVVDNTFGTPVKINLKSHGVDIVVHSATKFINGHGTAIGGVVVDEGTFDWKATDKYPWISEPNPSYHGLVFADAAPGAAFATYIRAIVLRDEGATISPFTAFLDLQGLETLPLRVNKHVENTLKVVDYLSHNPNVEAVHHPSLPTEPSHDLYEKYFPQGGGSVLTFEIKGDADTAKKWIDNLPIFSLLANVGDAKSLVIHPASTTHSQLTEEELLDQGIKPNTIRLSIGIEDADDLIAALDAAFDAIK